MSQRQSSIGHVVCLGLLLLLAGCSGSLGPARRLIQTQLQLPHLQWLSSLSRIPEGNGDHGGLIYGLVALQHAASTTPRILVTLDGQLHLIGLDGTGHHQLGMGGTCIGRAIITTDENWVACVTYNTNSGDNELLLSPLNAGGTTHARQVQLQPGNLYGMAAWSPDGHYFALVLDGVTVDFVGIFSSPPPHDTFTLAARLTPDQFVHPAYEIRDLSWSADGDQLRILSNGPGGNITMADVSVAPVLASASGLAGPVTMDIPTSQFQPVGLTGRVRCLAWNPVSHALTYVIGDGSSQTVSSVDLRTHAITPLLTISDEDHTISGIEWLPDGQRLLLVVDGYRCVDCGAFYLSDVYLYSPSPSSLDGASSPTPGPSPSPLPSPLPTPPSTIVLGPAAPVAA